MPALVVRVGGASLAYQASKLKLPTPRLGGHRARNGFCAEGKVVDGIQPFRASAIWLCYTCNSCGWHPSRDPSSHLLGWSAELAPPPRSPKGGVIAPPW